MTALPDLDAEVVRQAVAEVSDAEEPLRDPLDEAREADLETLRRAGLDP
jgi:hypothetical protein